MNAMQCANKLIKEVNERIANTEYNLQKMKGVKNLSRSDLESAVLYAEQFIQNGGYGFQGFMEPRGGVKELLDAYGVSAENAERFS